MCLFTSACDGTTTCANLPLTEQLDCLSTTAGVDHIDYLIPVTDPNSMPCVTSFKITLPAGMRCTNPKLEYEQLLPDGYTFLVQSAGAECELQLVPPPGMPGGYVGDHHLLISFEGPTMPLPRDSVFVGVSTSPHPTCTSTITTLGNLTVNTCM